jgi:polyketide biosynthesis enoyl-CoA hydratase PksI
VVQLNELEGNVVEITMRDAENHNTFSYPLIDGLVRCFDAIQNDDRYKIVILTGYDTYFASGGTKELLNKMCRGEIRFNDLDFFRLPLDCALPVICAMQGHGLGGGFIFGLYGDFIVLSRESVYTANFMKFGFTPGMGATLLAPLKLGYFLGHEMLFTARNYRGEELAQRGLAVPVVPRKEVLPYARRMAALMAEKPRLSLITLKQHMTRNLREQLPKAIEMEVRMHDATFGQDEVADRIDQLFGL